MDAPDPQGNSHNIALVMVGVVALAIMIIAALTLIAILSGPPEL